VTATYSIDHLTIPVAIRRLHVVAQLDVDAERPVALKANALNNAVVQDELFRKL